MTIIHMAKKLREHYYEMSKRFQLTAYEHLSLALCESILEKNFGQADSIKMFKKVGEIAGGEFLLKEHTVLVATLGESLKIDAGLTGQVFFEPIALDEQTRVGRTKGDE